MKSAILFALTASLAAASLPVQAQTTENDLQECWRLCAELYPNNPAARAGCRQNNCIRGNEGRRLYTSARDDVSLVSKRFRGTKLHQI
jgi:hypothetical protein